MIAMTQGKDIPSGGSRRWTLLVSGSSAVGIATVAIVAILVVYPLGWLAYTSIESPGGGSVTLDNYREVFSTPRYLEAIWNSLKVSSLAATVGLMLGVPMAWAVSRTDMPFKGLVRLIALGSLLTPSFLTAVAWILLAGPNAGLLNRIVVTLIGVEKGPFNIYSLAGLSFVIALHIYPYVFLLTASALELVSSEMEDAANILGAGVWRTMMAVTLPLALPAIVGGFLLAFLDALSLFGTPLLLAVPARIQVMPTQLWQFFQFPSKVEYAAAYSLPLLLITGALFLVQKRLIGRKRFATFTGKGGERRILRLGRWRYALLFGCLLVAFLSVVLPYLTLLIASLSRSWAQGVSWTGMTLDNFALILLQHDTPRRAIVNTLTYSVAAACAATALGFMAAYLINRGLIRGGAILANMVMAPLVIPGIVLAIGFVAAYTRPPLLLYGTAWIMILAYTTRFLPIAFQNADAALRSVHPELEEAARIGGAGLLKTLRAITLPLIKGGVFGGGLLILMAATRELSTAIFLFTANTKVASVVLVDLSETGDYEVVSALAIVMLLVILGLASVGYGVIGRRVAWQRAGE
jgi:iron(III) transport system permease protein